jgi:hypothetical protein
MMILAEGFSLTEVGLTAFCLLCVIKMILDQKNKTKDASGNNQDVAKLAIQGVKEKLDEMANIDNNFRRDCYVGIGQTKDLYDWHNVNDADGRKIWYVKASLETSIKQSTDATRDNTDTLKELILLIKGLDN